MHDQDEGTPFEIDQKIDTNLASVKTLPLINNGDLMLY